MITYSIYYNRTYKRTCNLIKKDIKGHSLHIYNNNDVLIDNNVVAKCEDVNCIEFLVGGYKQIIEVNANGKIIATDELYQ